MKRRTFRQLRAKAQSDHCSLKPKQPASDFKEAPVFDWQKFRPRTHNW